MRNYRTGLLPQVRRRNIESGIILYNTRAMGIHCFACFSYSVQSDLRCSQPLCAGHRRLSKVSLGRRTFLHEFRRWLAAYRRLYTFAVSLLFVRFIDTIPSSDFPGAYISGVRPLTFPDRADCIPQSVTPGISRFPCKELAYMHQFYDSADPVRHLR